MKYRPLSPARIAELSAGRPLPEATLSVEDLEARIASVWFNPVRDAGGTLRATLCTIELDNGFQVPGESLVLDPNTYVRELSEHYAYHDAFRQLWPYFALMEKERVFIAVGKQFDRLTHKGMNQ